MYRKMVNALRGEVKISVECHCPERVVNLCAAHGIPFWSLCWQDETHCTMHTTRRALAQVKACTAEVPCTIQKMGEWGLPLTCRRLRRRYVLLAGLALFLTLLIWGSLCIWEFRVSGNETVPTGTILRAMEECGVRTGMRGRKIDQEDVRNHVLLMVPDLSWLAVNVKGCVAHVQVVERHRPPERVAEEVPTNVIARKSGIVEKVEALGGEAKVSVGDTVTEGQILISGVVDSTRHGARWVHGMGRITGRTWPEVTVVVPLERTERTEERKRQFHSLNFGKYRIKFYGKGRKIGPGCDKITRYRPLTLPGGLQLPFTWVTETVTQGHSASHPVSEAAARREGEAAARQILHRQLESTGQVEREAVTAVRRGKVLLVTLHAECVEEIGEEVILPLPQWNERVEKRK